MPAVNYDLTIEQGATFCQKFVWKDSEEVPVDLSTYTARMQIRTSCHTDALLVSLTSASGITLGSDGSILIEIDAITTAGFPIVKGHYDLELISVDDTVTRLVQGSVVVSGEVTR